MKEITTFSTACPRNCYSTCSLNVTVDVKQQRILRIEANPLNLATPKGPCLKGLSYIEQVHSPERILYPMKRLPGQNQFQRISWDETLDIIVSQLLHFKEKYGPQSILYYTGSGTKGLLNQVGESFWRLFGGYTGTYGDLCWPAGLEATRLTLGACKHNVPWDIENAQLIILWGKNPAETNIQQMRSIDRAIEKGAHLIVIDPRRTPTADRAELLLQPRPGTDGALALGIAHLLIKTNTINHPFINQYVLGFEEFKKLVYHYPPHRTSMITDIPEPLIHQLAKSIAHYFPISICPGYGMQRYTNGGQTMRALLSLIAITGNIGKPGAGWIYANLQSAIFSNTKDPIASFPPTQPDGIARISISTARLGPDMLAQSNPPLKMIWVERANPITQNPGTHTLLKAFQTLEFRVVIEQFFTDTAREADIILPAKSLFEQSDIIGAYWHPYIQLRQKLIEPPGEVKPETEIYYLLAKKLKWHENTFKNLIPKPTNQDIKNFLEKKLEKFPDLSLEKLKQGPILAPGTEEIAFADLSFPTPSGKIELYSQEAQDRWNLNPLPDFTEPVESIYHLDEKTGNPAKYALYFMTPNTKNRIHSQFNNLNLIRQFSPKPILDMNPADAIKRSIQPGDQVKVFNDRGQLELEARVDFSIKPGCVSVSNGWWISEGGTVNFLSIGRETDMGYGAAFHDTLVEVEKR